MHAQQVLENNEGKLACPACIQSQNIDITNSTASLQAVPSCDADCCLCRLLSQMWTSA